MWALYYNEHVYGRTEKSHCISNLIYVASCFFVPSQYDEY